VTLFRDSSLDGNLKGQAIQFLSQMELVQGKRIYGPLSIEDRIPIISLNKTNLSNMELYGRIDLNSANLQNVDLTGAKLQNVDLTGAKLHAADFTRASFKSVILSGTNLHGATLINADFRQSNFSNASVRDADLTSANLQSANLHGTDFTGANLSKANLQSANLHRTDFAGANLTEANLTMSGSPRTLLSTSQSSLTQPQLERAHLCRTLLPEGIQLSPDRDCDSVWRPTDNRLPPNSTLFNTDRNS
jgi:hypothetical protein